MISPVAKLRIRTLLVAFACGLALLIASYRSEVHPRMWGRLVGAVFLQTQSPSLFNLHLHPTGAGARRGEGNGHRRACFWEPSSRFAKWPNVIRPLFCPPRQCPHFLVLTKHRLDSAAAIGLLEARGELHVGSVAQGIEGLLLLLFFLRFLHG